MATVVQKPLQLEEANVEQYCTADGLSLNAGGYAIRKWLNGSTSGYAILNDAAKEVLYPTSTAHPFKADSEIRGSRSAGDMIAALQFAGTNVHTESFTSTSLSTRTKTDISYSVVTGSSRNTQIRWNIQGANGNTQRVAHVKLVLYFYQYSMSANIGTGANGVQSVRVSDAAPYYGDTVTFTPKLVNGATWHGWYSDVACTQLVSASQNYTVSPNSDLTLYAKATIDATTYNCVAIAGENIASAIVSDEKVISGESVTFTATVNEHCTFGGWFSDGAYTTLVSAENPYTAVITADTTLYAKATKISYSVSTAPAEHGTASVSSVTAHYGDNVNFTFTPEDETWELYGWYSDAGHTQLVSEDNPYTHTITDNIVLYPEVGKKRYKITVGRYLNIVNGDPLDFDVFTFYYNDLTREEQRYLETGNYSNIDQSKLVDKTSAKGFAGLTDVIATILCPYDACVGIFMRVTNSLGVIYNGYIVNHTYWPYYWFKPTGDTFLELRAYVERQSCVCTAIAQEGIDYAYATTPTRQEQNAVFTAEVAPGYYFLGWYPSETSNTRVSIDNPARVATPTNNNAATSLTLYARAARSFEGTGIYLKTNGAHQEAQAVYKKIDGAWVTDVDSCKALLSQLDRVGTIVKRL